jgi:Uma2 family endonuclease
MATEILEQATDIADEQRLTRRRAAVEEFWSLPESTRPAEYINGEIVMAPSPTVSHQTVHGNLYFALRTFVQANKLGKIFYSPLDVLLPTGDVVQSDLFFLNVKQVERVRTARRVEEVPSFIIEILSPGSIALDAITKRALYEKNGVREYWIVDLETRSIAQLMLRKRHYALTEAGESDVIKSAVLAGFEIKVGELLGA